MPKANKYPQLAQAELDLHGLTREEALYSVKDFLHACRGKKLSQVRIITGKGLHSENGSVLREAVAEYLRREPDLKFTTAKYTEGGDGALTVKFF